jgi:hypothetical protein
LKKLLTLALGMSMILGTATFAWAQGKDAPKQDEKGKGDTKGKDGKGDQKK